MHTLIHFAVATAAASFFGITSSQGDERYATAAPNSASRSIEPSANLLATPQHASADAEQGNPLRSLTPVEPRTPVPTLATPPQNAPQNPFTPGDSSRVRDSQRNMVDQVAPLGQVPSEAASPLQPLVKPSRIAKQIYATPQSGELNGVTLSLAETVRGVSSRSAQTLRARSYWELSTTLADYYLALLETEEMRSLAQGANPNDGNWQQALANQQARTLAAKRSAEAAQFQLQRLLGRDGPSSLPIPSDQPHAGRYETRFDEIFSTRRDPAAQQLHETLPVTYEMLESLTSSIEQALQRVVAASQGRLHGAPESEILLAHEMLALLRREFISTLRQYNLQIADYIELAAPHEVGTERLVSMLISTAAEGDPWRSPDVRTASGAFGADDHETMDQASHSAAPLQSATRTPLSTYQQGQTRQVRRPVLDALRSRERSILKRPIVRRRSN